MACAGSLALFAPPASAGSADVISARVRCKPNRECTFQVTVFHVDQGRQHYANLWEIVAPNGTVLGTRVLTHPHVNEQPFVRVLNSVKVPPSITKVTVRAHDSRHGFGGAEMTITIPRKRPAPN